MLTYGSGAGNAVTFSKESSSPFPPGPHKMAPPRPTTRSPRSPRPAPRPSPRRARSPGDIRTRITEALTTIIQTAAGKAHELSDAVTTELKIAAMTVDYPQSSHHLGDPTAWV